MSTQPEVITVRLARRFHWSPPYQADFVAAPQFYTGIKANSIIDVTDGALYQDPQHLSTWYGQVYSHFKVLSCNLSVNWACDYSVMGGTIALYPSIDGDIVSTSKIGDLMVQPLAKYQLRSSTDGLAVSHLNMNFSIKQVAEHIADDDLCGLCPTPTSGGAEPVIPVYIYMMIQNNRQSEAGVPTGNILPFVSGMFYQTVRFFRAKPRVIDTIDEE